MWQTVPVELDRQFRTVTTEEAKEPRQLFEASVRGELHWGDLLVHKRVVVLAEAGSGKSYEFEARAKALVNDGAHAVYATVQDLGRSGLDGALGPTDRARLGRWRVDSASECWFFIDSVDEAKDVGITFDTAMRQLANGIAGYEERANLIISGRFADWDFLIDPKAITKWLAIPEPPQEAPDFRALIVDTLHNRKPDEAPVATPASEPLILLMTALDQGRVERFAKAQGIPDVEPLIAALDKGQLWRMAGRPLDLGWMVNYWRTNRRLGALHAMMDASLEARLKEPSAEKRKKSTLSIDCARTALNRIGAALVLTGEETILLSGDGEAGSGGQKGLSLERTLSDWPEGAVAPLLTRPVFDPALFGRVRLHNDNEGAVRSFLAARWLQERLAGNCPPKAVFDLLFADVYGLALVRPDMAETAAWLALKRPEIFEAFLERQPIGLLTRGDPAGFDASRRIRLVEAVLQAGKSPDQRLAWYSRDFIRRLAGPDFDPMITVWWERYSADEDSRHLLLELIGSGKLACGREAARAIAYDITTDEVSQVLASRALLQVDGEREGAAYADFIIAAPDRLPRALVLGALNELFPKFIGVEGYFALIDSLGSGDGGHGGGGQYYPLDRALSEALVKPSDLIDFVQGVVDRIGPFKGHGEHTESAFFDAFTPLAVAAATRLLTPETAEVPPCAVELILKLNDQQWSRARSGEETRLAVLLVLTPARRRQTFWRAAHQLQSHPWQKGQMPSYHQMIHFGWPGGLTVLDLDWLLADAVGRDDAIEQGLALKTALGLARDQDPDGASLERIRQAVAGRFELEAMVAVWVAPPEPNPQTEALVAESAARRQEHEKAIAKRDASWVDLIARLRDHPEEFDALSPQTDMTADSRLIHLYQFLSSRTVARSRYSISDLAAVEPIFGPALTAKFGAALISFARQRDPLLSHERPAESQQQTSSFDIMGLAGISLAATQPAWLQTATRADLARAARYGLLELNGFPDYFPNLARAHPDIVRPVLEAAVSAQLNANTPESHAMLDRLAYADPVLGALVLPLLMRRMAEPALHPAMLAKIAAVIVLQPPPTQLADLALDAAETIDDLDKIASFLTIAFYAEADRAVDRFDDKLAGLDASKATALCVGLLPRLFGDRFRRQSKIPVVSFAKLVRLVEIAFTHVRPKDDIERPSGEVFSPGARDAAQDARYALLTLLQKTPGEATYAVLMRYAAGEGPIEAGWARSLAAQRAADDACLPTWDPEDLAAFERDHERAPGNSLELQDLARRRVEKISHDLLHDKFAQGATLKAQPDETAVQNWVADRFNSLRAQAYTVERETHVVGEKEPDITLTSQRAPVSLPIEIKVVDDLSLAALEVALSSQLCGQYLRHETTRHGVLLLVYQKLRSGGWNMPGLSGLQPWSVVMAHLEEKAAAYRSADPAGPQPIVLSIDVSQVVPRRRNMPSEGSGAEPAHET